MISASDELVCVDQNELEVYGDFALMTSRGSAIIIDVVKCTGEDNNCKSDREIELYFYQKLLIQLFN